MKNLNGVWLGDRFKVALHKHLFIQATCPKFTTSGDKYVQLQLLGVHLHMGDLFPAFRNAERRVRVSLLHLVLLGNFNSKQSIHHRDIFWND